MAHSPHPLKRICIDAGGVSLIICAGLFGWLPGPGGIPLFLGGLSLLAINHSWARRWLKLAQKGSAGLNKRIFVDFPALRWLFDIVGVGLMFVASYLLYTYTHSLVRSVAISIGFIGLGLFMANRQRLQTFITWVKQKLPKKT